MTYSLQGVTLNEEYNPKLKYMSDVDYFIKYVSMNSFMGHLTESHMRKVRAKFSNEDYTEPKSITSSSFKQIEFHTQLSS